jgi:hypothetical protein
MGLIGKWSIALGLSQFAAGIACAKPPPIARRRQVDFNGSALCF